MFKVLGKNIKNHLNVSKLSLIMMKLIIRREQMYKRMEVVVELNKGEYQPWAI
jgi:hypothetical protein